ncbi:hypothetical protein NLG42_22750 [Flavobacterium plurextorum]|uniref:Uncharacterized protein n=1 Tax=Flavobacterium plurextorum TaxID=1114867 RepID=A0ABX4CSC7_9FLAO|nr:MULTISPECIES: hypothetical protein [Flavobacterium]OXB05496.1 hypothetical protein B0A81_14635 [Flavobacterium plurextorum]PIF71473.1 hypothetical protein CLU99_2245 [Flavobacterium sp. 2]UUW08906.1 hypothetical protein NLG42_22750 [Flavobacterium plurextorum]
MRNSEFEIHPFNEGFYVESLLNKTRSILNDVESLNKFWKKGYYDCKNDNIILDLFQNIILNVGGISRFFWPSKNTGYYKIRAEKLRKVYNVSESSVLKNRDMRNHIEHFDEKLDDFLEEFTIGTVMQKYVGPLIYVDDNRTFFRAYFCDKNIFKMFNIEYEMGPIINEIKRIHKILLLQKENRGRF